MNVSSYWHLRDKSSQMITDFIQKHTCTKVCKSLSLPELCRIAWPQETHQDGSNSHPNTTAGTSRRTHGIVEQDMELILVVRKGKTALKGRLE
jgi:hypothetical protein